MNDKRSPGRANMPSDEKQLPFFSKNRAYIASYAKLERKQLVRRLLYSLLLGLFLLGTILFKQSVVIVDVQHINPSGLTVTPDVSTEHSNDARCPQVDPLSPGRTTRALKQMDRYLSSEDYTHVSADLLSKAITYRTVSYDNMSDPDLSLDDPLYDPFKQFFRRFIRKEFPYLSNTLELEKKNKHGLFYTWKGTNDDLKPILLLAHQDVVPVDDESLDDWEHDPWSGEVEDGYIYGRGLFDTKHTVVAILEAVEALVAASFEPERTLLLSFGFDEEIGGLKGATELAAYISKEYEDGAAIIVDEGSAQVKQWGTDMVVFGVTEKGMMPVDIEVRTPGGHASVPPDHTGIGIMSEIVEGIEDHRYNTYLSQDHPMLEFLTCAQEHAASFPAPLESLLEDRLDGNVPPIDNDTLATEFVTNAGLLHDVAKWSLTTAKSVNVIQGGVKLNSLPKYVLAQTDVRVHIAENIESTQRDYSDIAKRVARDHDLTFIDFDALDQESPEHYIKIGSARSTPPAKISPFKIKRDQDTPWSILAGTTKHVLGSNLIVSPGMSAGNTDARHYQNVSDYIYRYSPGATIADSVNMHTVNEAMSIQNHVAGVRWYSNFIRNMDEVEFEFE
ncbi:MAG: hypothetical protein Q9160_009094 [Pyrenula sp. 1 TL-2023]